MTSTMRSIDSAVASSASTSCNTGFDRRSKWNEAACIVFDEEAIPKPANQESRLVVLRVEKTSYYLFLDAPRLVEGRKRRWRECLKWIHELEALIPMDLSLIDEHRFAQIARIEANIREMTRPDQPYASMIRSCLRLRGMDYLIETPEAYEMVA